MSKASHKRSVMSWEAKELLYMGRPSLPWCGFADDLVLFLLEPNWLKSAAELLNNIFESFGLTINKLKTETWSSVFIILHGHQPQLSEWWISKYNHIAGWWMIWCSLNNVHVFKYLGSYINAEEPNTGNAETNYRIQTATTKFAEMSNLHQNFRINLRTRINFLDSYVRSRPTYACQDWNLTDNQLERLNATYE